jgi:hypothetical protein
VDTTGALEQKAVDLARRGDFGTDAKSVNQELTRVAPANQGAWTRLARCCLELGLLDDATAALDAALQLNPQNTIARNLQIEVTKRRAGPPVETRTSARRSSSGAQTAAGRTSATARSPKARTAVLLGLGRAEFTALGHLAPTSAVESLTARIEPLLMALNERPFAAKVVEARNRAGHAGARLFRRGSVQPVAPGYIDVCQQGGRWEPQLAIGFLAAPQWGRDAVSAGIGFDLAEGGAGDKAESGRERIFEYFQAFQYLISATWRQHLTDWMRVNGGFIQLGRRPPVIDLLPYDALERFRQEEQPGERSWMFVGRWLFADRGEDMTILTDGARLVRWLEQTFNDLLPLWGTIYREKYKS